MKRLALAVVLLLSACTAIPCYAQTAVTAPDPWHHGTNEYILDGNYSKQADGHWRGKVTTAWAHFVTDNVEVGSIASFTSVLTQAVNPTGPAETVQGTGAGAFYEYNVPLKSKKFHLFAGGDSQYLTGQLSDLSTYVYSTRVGLKWHVGKSSAVRLSFDVNRAGQQTDAGAALNQNGVNLGISVGSGT